MTPKRLGILIVALVALWSLVGPAEAPNPQLVPGISGVMVAQAGDPDQYTNKPVGSSPSPPDTSQAPPALPPDLGGHMKIVASSTFRVVIRIASILLWEKGSIY